MVIKVQSNFFIERQHLWKYNCWKNVKNSDSQETFEGSGRKGDQVLRIYFWVNCIWLHNTFAKTTHSYWLITKCVSVKRFYKNASRCVIKCNVSFALFSPFIRSLLDANTYNRCIEQLQQPNNDAAQVSLLKLHSIRLDYHTVRLD